VQGIGADDAAFDPQRDQKLGDPAQFILFGPHDLFFEQDACPDLIESHLMHLLLVFGQMRKRPAQGLVIQGHMNVLFSSALSHQPARFLSTAFRCRRSDQQLREYLIDLLRIHHP
jgi:hypothetical protein